MAELVSLDALVDRRQRAVPRGLATATSFFAERGEGAFLFDREGRQFIDFASGIGVLAVGQCHPRVVAAIKQQADLYLHACSVVVMYEPYVRVAERLNELTPGAFPKQTLLVSSGAEAIENAVKIARVATGRSALVAFEGSFHGRTLLGMSLTGRAHPYRTGFGPFAPEVYHAPYPNAYRGPSTEEALEAMNRLFRTQVPAQEVAAVVVEPILGEGGFVPAPPEFLRELRAICSREGIVLIVDEIQSGLGRTGKLFAVEHAGIEPDILVAGKALAGGLPLASVTARADLADAVPPGGLGGTYGGNPVACAAALAVLDVFQEERLVERAAWLGALLERRLDEWAEEYPLVGDARGLGAMRAFELVADRQSRTPAPEATSRVLAAAHANGLLVLKAGLHDNVVRLLVPLVIEEATLNQGLDILERALAQAHR